jgi:hypothetical protein
VDECSYYLILFHSDLFFFTNIEGHAIAYRDIEEDHHAEWMDINDEEYTEESDDDNISVCVATLLLGSETCKFCPIN